MSPCLVTLVACTVLLQQCHTAQSRASDFTLQAELTVNEGTPLQSTVQLPMVVLAQPQPPFAAISASTPVVSNSQPSLKMIWKLDSPQNVTASVPYTIVTSIGDPSIIPSQPTLSIPTSGSFPNTPSSFTFSNFSATFQCASLGTTSVTFNFLVGMAPDLQQASVHIQKECLPPSCTGQCVKGNCVGALCFCDTRYDWTTYCDVGFWANKTEVCPGEPFTVQWDFAGNLSTGNPQDEFLVAYPLEASPFATWSVASFIQAQSSNEIMRHSSSFLYRMAGETEPVGVSDGQFTMQINDEREKYGSYGLVLWPQGENFPVAVLTLTLLAKSDPRCVPAVVEPTCSGRGYVTAQWNCQCNSGFFGQACEHGCGASTLLTAYGQDFSSSSSTAPFFLNRANCTWKISPTPTIPGMAISAVHLHFSSVVTESGYDEVDVYADSIHPTNLLVTLSGEIQDYSITVPSTTAVVHFHSDQSFPSWPGVNEGWNATYYAEGCAEGHVILKTGSEWRCEPCPAGQFTNHPDTTDTCLVCPAGTFAPTQGMSQCLQCGSGEHTNGANQSTSCSLCPEGTYAQFRGTAACAVCPEGTYSEQEGSVKCLNCDVDSYNPTLGSSFCLKCPANTQAPFQRATSLLNCECMDGFYSLANSSGQECSACPPGARCDGALARPQALEGYWFSASEPLRMWQCVNPVACPGGEANTCREGHTGKLCAACAEGYSMNSRLVCQPCVGGSDDLKLPFFILGLLLMGLLLLLIFTRRRVDELFLKETLKNERLLDRHLLPGFATSLGIAITYLQIMGTFGRYSGSWPSSVNSAWNVFNVLNLDVNILSVQCSVPMDYQELFVARILLPLFLVITFFVLYLCQILQWGLVHWCKDWFTASFPTLYHLALEHEQWEIRSMRRRILYKPPLGEEDVSVLLDHPHEHSMSSLHGADEDGFSIKNAENSNDGPSLLQEDKEARERNQPEPAHRKPRGLELDIRSFYRMESVIDKEPFHYSRAPLSPSEACKRYIYPPSSPTLVPPGERRESSGTATPDAPDAPVAPSSSSPAHAGGTFDFTRSPLRGRPLSQGRRGSISAHERAAFRRLCHSAPPSPILSDTNAVSPQPSPNKTITALGKMGRRGSVVMGANGLASPICTPTLVHVNNTMKSGVPSNPSNRRRSIAFHAAPQTPPKKPDDLTFEDDEHTEGMSVELDKDAEAQTDPEPQIGLLGQAIVTIFTERLYVRLEACVVSIVFFLNLFYIYLVSSAVELFDCKQQADGTYTMNTNPSIDCYSNEWNELLPFAIFGLVVYGLGVPIWMAIVLCKYIAAEQEGVYKRTRTFWHNFPYHASFRNNLYWWGLILLVRKLLISIAVVSITSDEGSKILVAFLILFISLYLQAQHNPYRLVVHNNLEFRMTCVCLTVLLCSLVFVNEQLNASMKDVMTVFCLFAIAACLTLIIVEVFLFVHPRWRKFQKEYKEGQTFLGAVREALLAV